MILPLFTINIPEMAQQERIDPGGDGSAFYNTVLEPADWWKWFQDDQASDEGWTEVCCW